jgi:hypothetical protein
MATQRDANQGVTHTESGNHVLYYIFRIHPLSSNAISRYGAKFFGKGNTDLIIHPARVYSFHLLVLSVMLTQDDDTCNDRLTGVGLCVTYVLNLAWNFKCNWPLFFLQCSDDWCTKTNCLSSTAIPRQSNHRGWLGIPVLQIIAHPKEHELQISNVNWIQGIYNFQVRHLRCVFST